MASPNKSPPICVDLTGTLTQKQLGQLKCVNRQCDNGDNLTDAIQLVCSYYNVNYKRSKEVCAQCLHQCLSHFKLLENKWYSGECVLDHSFPNYVSHHVIESSSSDEEEEEPRPSTSRGDPVDVVESSLKDLIDKFFEEKESFIKKQVEMCDKLITSKMVKCLKEVYDIDKLSRDAEHKANLLLYEIYEPFKPVIHYESSLDISDSNSERENEDNVEEQIKKRKLDKEEDDNVEEVPTEEIIPAPADLPKIGPQEYPPLKDGDWIFAMRTNLVQPWCKGKIKSVINEFYMHVKFGADDKLLTTKEIAYFTPNSVEFQVGSRVIAKYSNVFSAAIPNSFYVGIIAEPPSPLNKFRYLIFFDDGCVEYRSHLDIRLIVYKSSNVWNDVQLELQNFIKTYLEKYPDRQMVKLTKEHTVRARHNNQWQAAKVYEVDASLVKLYFPDTKVYEWVYRGSSRFWKIYEKQRNDEKGIRLRQSGITFLKQPFVEYTTVEPRNVARKSTAKKSSSSSINKCLKSAQNNDIDENTLIDSDLFETIEVTVSKAAPRPKRFTAHNCNHSCIAWTTYDYSKTKHINMLAIPLFFGFFRTIIYFNDIQKCIVYKAPCGISLRSMKEMFDYLVLTRSKMTIDLFDFNSWVNPLDEFQVLQSKKFITDLSGGKEFRGITCVNNLNYKIPPSMVYMTTRQAMPGVTINVDSNFLCGCDCTDNCQDKSQCACWQLTIKGQEILPKLYKDPNIGYSYRRLPERVLTGIYECNKTCKCSSSCLNRVVQFPLSQKLQLFMTQKKGWGVRCLNDIPQGSFICNYVGYLLTETDANEGGLNYGDEYLAELDYIEVVEKIKEDYESDISLSDLENSDCNDNDDSFRISESSDEDYQSTSEGKKSTSEMSLRLRKRKQSKNDNSKTKKDSKLVVSKSKTEDIKNNSIPSKSIREYFGDNESVYIMDAKTSGNIGRYINHSCNPNTFVQNTFVDTHDPRFPWISFFALHYISAGTELTWDYSYDIGSVPGKEMKCHCGSRLCRGRLL